MTAPLYFEISTADPAPAAPAVDIAGDGPDRRNCSRAVPGVIRCGDAELEGDGLHETNEDVIRFGEQMADLAERLTGRPCENPCLETPTPEELEPAGDRIWSRLHG